MAKTFIEFRKGTIKYRLKTYGIRNKYLDRLADLVKEQLENRLNFAIESVAKEWIQQNYDKKEIMMALNPQKRLT